jgi:AAA+ ATPase superfamily predicted ATPase
MLVYGRRRVGKTELIKRSLPVSSGKSLYFLGEVQKEEDIAGTYGVVGGIPRYAEEFDLKDFSNYFSILKAVAFGKNSFNEISYFLGVPTSKLYAYMSKTGFTADAKRFAEI